MIATKQQSGVAWRGRVARPVTAVLLVLAVVAGAHTPLYGQTVRLVPPLPAPHLPVGLVAREVLPDQLPAASLTVVRFGHAADARAPVGFPFPVEGRAVELHRFDWVQAGTRAVELRPLPTYQDWVRVERGSHVVVFGPNEVSLWAGRAQWRTADEHNARLLRLGNVELFGDGRAEIERTPWSFRVRVERGRFFLRAADGGLTSLTAGDHVAGRLGELPDGADSAAQEAAYRMAERRAQDTLQNTIAKWLSGESFSPETLGAVFEAAETFGPWYAHAALFAMQWPDAPDRTHAHIAELLRFLSAHETAAPPLGGR